jgi:hypothetical protein
MEQLEQTRHTPEATWEDHADDLKTTIKNAFDGTSDAEPLFFGDVDGLEYEDLLEIIKEPLKEYIDRWKSDAHNDALFDIHNAQLKTREREVQVKAANETFQQ